MGAVVVLDRGHHGKKRDDRGARSGSRVEEVGARRYMATAEDELRAAGVRVIVQSSSNGSHYFERWERAKRHRADVYVQCHWNAGGGSYALNGYDHRSRGGPQLAARVAAAQVSFLPELQGDARAVACFPKNHPGALSAYGRTADPNWTRRMYGTISGVYDGRPVGLVYEPGFIDNPAHLPLWSDPGMARVGRALAAGIVEHLHAVGRL